MKIARFEVLMALVGIVAIVSPAEAVMHCSAPAPVAGLGMGALAAVGAGYRALRRRLGN